MAKHNFHRINTTKKTLQYGYEHGPMGAFRYHAPKRKPFNERMKELAEEKGAVGLLVPAEDDK